ncbi:MAG: M48 family metallopeptidase [Arenimonas sp.]|uniref:M48 family metallopeptidase n=1 Tax=Arenimonas sp. TaxID=1872635 RepID=UPI0025BE353B|nr:M48 family metallopeptidase [Arenimonas sp.]MBW8368308.1 M48 family metallopeptidase [Arenimonas sp.]
MLRVESEGMALEFASAEVTLSPRLGSMPRTLTLPGEGHLELADSPLLDQWVPTSSRIEAAAHWLEQRRSAAIGAGVATVLGVVFFFQVALPWMANELAPVIPSAMERTITRQAMALIDRVHTQPSKLPEARRAELQQQFTALVAGLPREADFRLEFRSAPKLGPNAFALPDGLVVVTDELVGLVESDRELVAVLAHEAGHHEQRHGMRQALQSSAVVVVAGFLFGDLSGTGSLSVSIPVLLLESGFSRKHEREADEFAFDLLRKRGRSPADFATAMSRLSRHHGEQDLGAVSYLSTHPASAQRIEAANRAAERKD